MVTPRVIADKEVTNLGDPLAWADRRRQRQRAGWPTPVTQITYDVTFTNTGGATAYDVDGHRLDGRRCRAARRCCATSQVGALPAGVTVVDGWTLADPDVVLPRRPARGRWPT